MKLDDQVLQLDVKFENSASLICEKDLLEVSWSYDKYFQIKLLRAIFSRLYINLLNWTMVWKIKFQPWERIQRIILQDEYFRNEGAII